MSRSEVQGESIAIIGMAGRFPGAKNLDEFWRNLRDGVESVSVFENHDLQQSPLDGLPPTAATNLVKARAILENPEWFDAEFFKVDPQEAEILDPQHRIFLETAWETLEDAGYNPDTYDGLIGLFAGSSMNTYLLANVLSQPWRISELGGFRTKLASDKDFLPTRVSYKLNLRGPSVNVQSACSTSLVAVCVACQNLLNYQCDMALAGGVSVSFPQKRGHRWQEGDLISADGHCRAFDARAAGTVSGEGIGIVALKRLSDALANGDSIRAVIKGCAINNDGSLKTSYTAPSVDSQAEVVAMAQANAGVDPDTISYVETHGTGSPLGDSAEIAGLTKAFRAGTATKEFCSIGSVKTNIGHLDAAAGVAGLIKTVLALQHRQLPPSLHFQRPHPKIDFANSPFCVNDRLREWTADRTPRRAGVSSFGIGGTNAHVILEEAPVAELAGPSRAWQLLLLSARSESALETATAHLVEYLKANPAVHLPDVAFTLQVGRKPLAQRRAVVCQSVQDAIQALTFRDAKRVFNGQPGEAGPSVVFMFPGEGSQHVNMGRELYETEHVFRQQVDLCCEFLRSHLELDLRTVIYPAADQRDETAEPLGQTSIAQTALFVLEYALARLWMSWGVRPQAMLGHGIGEYVAACLAGVCSLEDALTLVAAGGRLIQKQPTGAMLSVHLPEQDLKTLLGRRVSLAAVNGPSRCVASGPVDAVEALKVKLDERRVTCQRLPVSHALHSEMIDPALHWFTAKLRKVRLSPPQIPYLSNLTGTWITAQEATDPNCWVAQLRQTVRFADNLSELGPGRVLLEVGPDRVLTTLAREHPAIGAAGFVVPSLERPQDKSLETASLLAALGQLWLLGLTVEWPGFYAAERRHRLPLPTCPFERKRYWIEPAKPEPGQKTGTVNSPTAPAENNSNRTETKASAGEAGVACATTIPLTDVEHALWIAARIRASVSATYVKSYPTNGP